MIAFHIIHTSFKKNVKREKAVKYIERNNMLEVSRKFEID